MLRPEIKGGCIRELGFEKLHTFVSGPNERSGRALERVGHPPRGVWRHHLFVGGHWLDAWLGEILREEWEAKEEKNA